MCSKTLTSKRALCAAVALHALLAGCGRNAAVTPAAPTVAYVRLAALEAAHPLQASVRDLDALAARLRGDVGGGKIIAAPIAALPMTVPPPAALSAISASDAARIRGARAALFAGAIETLRRYDVALRAARLKIIAEKRAELAGVARAEGRLKVAGIRKNIDDRTRRALFDGPEVNGQTAPPDGRAYTYLNTQIKHDNAKTNLTQDNVVSVARDDAGVRSKAVLQKQISVLGKNPKAVVSDEARLTKTRDDLAVALDQFDTEDADIVDAATVELRREIARVRAEDAARVDEQVAKLIGSKQDQKAIDRLRAELTTVLRRIVATDQNMAGDTASAMQTTQSTAPAPHALLLPAHTSPAARDNALRRIARERAHAVQTIASDTAGAVRDAALLHGLTAVFAPAALVPDRTADFAGWIFGSNRNVSQTPLSNPVKIPERTPSVIGTTREAR